MSRILGASCWMIATIASATPVRGTVVDEHGVPQAGCSVVLHPAGTPEAVMIDRFAEEPTNLRLTGSTNASGVVDFADVPPGHYTVRVFERSSGSRSRVARDAWATVDVLASGRTTFRAAFLPSSTMRGLPPGPGTPERRTSLVGRLVDERQRPWPGVKLYVEQGAGRERIRLWATTDAQGRFQLSGLQGGPATLHFNDPLMSHVVPELVRKRADRPLLPIESPLVLPAQGEVRIDATFAVAPQRE